MKTEKFKEKVSNFFSRVGKRNMIIVASFVVAAAVFIAGIAMFGGKDKGFDYSQGVGMNGDSTGTGSATEAPEAADTYFSSVAIERQRSRDEALEVLQSVVDNKESSAAAKEEALAEINKMAKTMETESNIETLVLAKGFEECVAVISGDNVSIVVKSDGLQAAQISQINEIVFEQSGIAPANTKIIQR